MRLVALVHVEDHGGHAFERARVLERTDIDGAIGQASGELGGELLRAILAAADQGITGIALDQVRRGERLQHRGDGPSNDPRDLLGQRALMAAGKDAVLREPEIAGDAQDGRRPDRRSELPCGLEGGIRLDGEDNEIGFRDDVLVAAAGDAELRCGRLRSLGVPRADEDLILPGLVESFCECAPERAGAADDRNLHANATASRATSARRLRAAASRISVFVTTGRTPVLESASASAASFSSMTSA